MRLIDKVSIVTGSAKGIGEGIAKKLGEHGSKIIIADIGSPSDLAALFVLLRFQSVKIYIYFYQNSGV